jgi:hypothetical protein
MSSRRPQLPLDAEAKKVADAAVLQGFGKQKLTMSPEDGYARIIWRTAPSSGTLPDDEKSEPLKISASGCSRPH